MAVARVKRVRILSHHDILEDVVASLQALGCCEIIRSEESDGITRERSSPPSESTGSGTGSRGLPRLETDLSDSRFILRFLEPLFKEEGGMLERLLGPKPPVTISELNSMMEKTDLQGMAADARSLERRISEMRSEISQLSNHIQLLKPFKDLDLPMWIVSRGTEKLRGVMGTLPSSKSCSLKDSFLDIIEGQGDIYIAPYSEKEQETMAVLVFQRSLEQQVMESASLSGFSRVDCPQGIEDTPQEEIQRMTSLRETLYGSINKAESESLTMAAEWVPSVRKIYDLLVVVAARHDAGSSGESSEKVSSLDLWVPSDKIRELESSLKPYSTLLDVNIDDPRPGENPPIILDNPGWASPFSPLTKLYGMPSYDGIDPTVVMAPFFFLFFGMCLGDGGYGLVMGAFFLFALVRYRLSGDTRNFFMLLLLGSVSSILVGAVTGSWLGDMIDVFGVFEPIRALKNSVVMIRPMNDPITFLAISLALGVVQILFGILIAMWDAFRKGDIAGALGDQGGWLALIVGILVWGASSFGIGGNGVLFAGKALSAIGAITLVATQGRDKPGVIRKALSGILSLYNITSYLGDVLSYSRLLALGLATSAIAMIVNTLTGLVSGIPYVGWMLAILIFFGGHLFSVVVNVLGAFIHSLRLQYVEFFSKFYSGGGRIFTPLKFETRYTRITGNGIEETVN